MVTLSYYPTGPMKRYELNELLLNWPKIMKQVSSPWARQFTEDIWELSADPKWRPTLKQAHFIRQIHRERSEGDIDVILIE